AIGGHQAARPPADDAHGPGAHQRRPSAVLTGERAGGTRGTVSSSAITAQPVAAKEMNCDLPPGSPLSKKICTGLLRVSTIQAPSSRCVFSRYATPLRYAASSGLTPARRSAISTAPVA